MSVCSLAGISELLPNPYLPNILDLCILLRFLKYAFTYGYYTEYVDEYYNKVCIIHSLNTFVLSQDAPQSLTMAVDTERDILPYVCRLAISNSFLYFFPTFSLTLFLISDD